MEEDIKLVENLIEEYKMFGDLDGIQDIRPYMKAIENMLNRNKELEEENKRLKPKIDVCNWQEKSCREIIDEKYVPVSLIKEKIEELGNMTLSTVAQRQEVSYAIAVLQELLEKRG